MNFPTTHLFFSSSVLEYVLRSGKSGIRTQLWIHDRSLWSVNDHLWQQAEEYIDYIDPENL